jgi:hypothetical protein
VSAFAVVVDPLAEGPELAMTWCGRAGNRL